MADVKQIVMIDDEADICSIVTSVLERTKRFKVLSSTHAKEGIELARTCKPDLVMLDVMMPEMEGTQIANILCEDEALKDVPIVFVTAIAIPMAFLSSLVRNDELKQKAGKSGGYFFIQKPISPNELIQRLDEILASADPGAAS